MAPRRKKYPWPALQFTEDSSLDTAALKLHAASSASQEPLPSPITVPRVPYSQRTSTWFYNAFRDIVQDDVNIQRRPSALERRSKAKKAAPKRTSKKVDQENRQLSRSYAKIELHGAPSVRLPCCAGAKRTDASSVLCERNGNSSSTDSADQREFRPSTLISVNCDVSDVVVLAPDTPESEYGMTIKMRQLFELKRQLF